MGADAIVPIEDVSGGWPAVQRGQTMVGGIDGLGEIRLRLAGDLHHYARERCAAVQPQGLSSDLVTCGSGGAFVRISDLAFSGDADTARRAKRISKWIPR